MISHPWVLDQVERSQHLDDFPAGEAWEEPNAVAADAHYTTIRLRGVDEVLLGECANVSAHYTLIDRLRRILPLTWEDSALSLQVERVAPELVSIIREHTAGVCADVVLRSRWAGDESLSKRIYGDGGSQGCVERGIAGGRAPPDLLLGLSSSRRLYGLAQPPHLDEPVGGRCCLSKSRPPLGSIGGPGRVPRPRGPKSRLVT